MSEDRAGRLALYKRDEVRRAIAHLLRGSGEVQPERDPTTGDYAVDGMKTLGVSEPPPATLLKELETHGVLARYRIDSVPSCPKCEHSNFYVDYVCPFGGHRNLERGMMIEHYACGHTGFETDFKQGNELVCPKCARTLKLVGTDHRKIDRVYRCLSDGRFFGTPTMRFTCRVCGTGVSPDETIMTPIFGDKLNEQLRSELTAYCTLETPLIELLKELGYEISAPKTTAGLSGIEHTFDIGASREGSEIAMDIVSGTKVVGPEGVARFFAKVFDSKPGRAILVVMPRLGPEAQTLSALYGFETVGGENSAQIVGKLRTLLGATVSPQT